ncbi:hypothetical protein HETIRDRAFT_149167 [Heterobasidion irregulare TC 32-1]|uniref:Uncharacterized protein n=1 Tax=Heterobasidion irregulare (strain TC 32-1) TaxID=747525 RepID=W4KC18_HETIT|nr:uncharacterized protein HETIRDRAFT_149167 [Heterobasidion irregulare TC 32-1]ETW82626.1 hypothetical protein HETIRDRAFT_149167 [Heterobasidion irregulare TC 32-1]
MIPGDYSNLFFSGLRVMAHTRRRVPSIPSAPSASSLSSIPSSPETDPASSSFRVRALKSLFQSMRRTPSKAPTSTHGPGAAEPSLHEKKAARRRTLPAATAAPADVFSVWIGEKSPLAQGSTAAVLHTHIEEEDPRPKTGALDPSSPSRSFVITLTEQHPPIPALAKDDDFLSFSASSTHDSPRRLRERPVSLPVPICLPSHPYRMSEHKYSDSTDSADAISCELANTDDWRQFHVEWIGREMVPLA